MLSEFWDWAHLRLAEHPQSRRQQSRYWSNRCIDAAPAMSRIKLWVSPYIAHVIDLGIRDLRHIQALRNHRGR